jgi:Autophagocytosis associated protein, active-site domain
MLRFDRQRFSDAARGFASLSLEPELASVPGHVIWDLDSRGFLRTQRTASGQPGNASDAAAAGEPDAAELVLTGADETIEEGTDHADVSTVVPAPSEAVAGLEAEVHIAFSPGYQVPVLWFRVAERSRRANGAAESVRFLPADEAVKSLRGMFSPAGSGDPVEAETLPPDLAFVSQGAHPDLGTMWSFVHPCFSSEILGTVTGDRSDPGVSDLLLWLSVYGQPVGISPSPDMARLALSPGRHP